MLMTAWNLGSTREKVAGLGIISIKCNTFKDSETECFTALKYMSCLLKFLSENDMHVYNSFIILNKME
jgi:hypothetical protein